jgi:hypothetical protein
MKYLVALLLGFVAGISLFCAILYFNPFAIHTKISPLAVTNQRLLNLSFAAVPTESLLFTNDGESLPAPHPAKVLELWERTVEDTRATVVILDDSRGQPAGIGVKFSSDSEDTRILNSQALVDSVWHIYLPGRGTMFIDQRENYWTYLHDVVAKARWSSADNWRGAWTGVTTAGPNALGTGRVTGGSGEFADLESEAVESLSATAYSAVTGPVAMDGNLTILLPSPGDDDPESD